MERVATISRAAFYRFEDVQGRRALRYATADLMRIASIVTTPTLLVSRPTGNRGYRGVLEIVFPLEAAVAQTHGGLRGTFALMVVMSCVWAVRHGSGYRRVAAQLSGLAAACA